MGTELGQKSQFQLELHPFCHAKLFANTYKSTTKAYKAPKHTGHGLNYYSKWENKFTAKPLTGWASINQKCFKCSDIYVYYFKLNFPIPRNI
jgi:hypothetical protein